jgi:hypothetical protein
LTEINEAVATERQENDISGKIIGAAIEVHKKLGPGLLESAYEECLCCEMQLRGIEFKRQVPLSLNYKADISEIEKCMAGIDYQLQCDNAQGWGKEAG